MDQRKKPKKIVTICASASHYKQVLVIRKDLEKLGYRVKIPTIANIMQKTKNFDVAFYKTWLSNKKDYQKKAKLMKMHFQKVSQADVILVANYVKHGYRGYIGGNVLMEMALAFHYKKPIYLLNSISDDLPFKEEVYGLFPIVLNGNLTKIF